MDKERIIEILARLDSVYPEIEWTHEDISYYSDKKVIKCLDYLVGHGLIEARESEVFEPATPFEWVKITSEGIDHLSKDGGLSAELNKHTAQVIQQNVTNNISGSGHTVLTNSSNNAITITNKQEIQNQLELLKAAIEGITDTAHNKAELLGIVRTVEQEIQSPTPNRTMVRNLLNSLPDINNLLSLGISIAKMLG